MSVINMNKTIAFITFYFLTITQLYASHHGHSAEKTPLIGIHGMVIFKANDGFYASHMPLANSIHAHQVVFSFSVDSSQQEPLDALFANNELVSISPEKFDLSELMSGELSTFSASAYSGHFERNGKLEVKSFEVQVDEILLAVPLGEHENGSFYELRLGSEVSMLVHKIGRAPSYDQILLARVAERALTDSDLVGVVKAMLGDYVNSRKGEFEREDIKEVSELYLELQDFQLRPDEAVNIRSH